jgi:hypothetical protein
VVNQLHNKLPCVIRTIESKTKRWVEYLARKAQIRYAFKILVQEHEGKKQLWISTLWRECNIRMAFQDRVCENFDSVRLAQGVARERGDS